MFGFGVGIQRLGSFGVDAHAALLALAAPGSGLRPTGFVYADPDTDKNGIYTWNGSAWQRDRGLPEQVATLTVTGGTANAIVAVAQDGVDLAQIVLSLLTPTATNTGAVTLNGKAIKDADGDALLAGALVAGKTYLLTDRGTEFRVLLNSFANIADIIGLQGEIDGLQADIATKADSSELDALEAVVATKADSGAMTTALAGKVSKAGDVSSGTQSIELITDASSTPHFVAGRAKTGTQKIQANDEVGNYAVRSMDASSGTMSIRTRGIMVARATEEHDHALARNAWKGQLLYVPRGASSATVAKEWDERGEVSRVVPTGSLVHINVIPRAWGAVGNGTTNDTAAFTLLETFVTGRVIDLEGRTYLVDATPTANDYVNGFFKVGTAVRSINYHKKRDVLWATDRAFGAGTGTGNDDSAALQAWLNACDADGIKNAYLPPTKAGYNLGSEVNTATNSGGISIYSDIAGSFTAGAGGGAKVYVGFDGIGFDLAGTLTKVQGIRFFGNRSLFPNGKGIRFAKTTNTDDMDGWVANCEFEEFFCGVDHNGRGLYLLGNVFALSDHGATFNWPASGVVGTGLHIPPYGMRKWLLCNNHFHSMGIALKNFGTEPMRGAVVNNNLMDVGRKFWEGPIHTSSMNGNMLENLSTVGIEITGTGGRLMRLIGNHIGGMEEPGGGDTSIHQPTQGIFFNVSGSTFGAKVADNTFDWIRKDAIRFHRAINYCNISDNVFLDTNTDADATVGAITVVNTSGLANAVTQCVIQGNTGMAVTGGNLLKVTTGALVGNIIDNVYAARTNWS